jgi:uncharacterized C2H2 Zn-finger protein
VRGRKKHNSEIVEEEQLVQEFPHRCPYCEQVVSYENIEFKVGENEIKCPSCKTVYIKVVPGTTGKRKNK